MFGIELFNILYKLLQYQNHIRSDLLEQGRVDMRQQVYVTPTFEGRSAPVLHVDAKLNLLAALLVTQSVTSFFLPFLLT